MGAPPTGHIAHLYMNSIYPQNNENIRKSRHTDSVQEQEAWENIWADRQIETTAER
jgi:hypothetical protein